SVSTADLDNDGDLDVMITMDRGRVVWSENFFISPFQISGRTYYDLDGNGTFDGNDVPLSAALSCMPSEQFAFAMQDGDYRFAVDLGQYTISPLLDNSLFSSTPADRTIVLSEDVPVANGLDFAITPAQLLTDAVVSFTSDPTTCGSLVRQSIDILNTGSTLLEGEVVLQLGEGMEFVSAVPPPTQVLGSSMHWSIDSLFFFSGQQIELYSQLPPADHVGDTLDASVTFHASVLNGEPSGTFSTEWTDVLRCAYDPNDKAVSPAGNGPHHAVDIGTTWLTYTIRFQNTGNAPATDVLIRDALSPSLDPSSLHILSTSHPLSSADINAVGEVHFRFMDIQLPDSGSDLLGSNGHVRFRIRPLPDPPSGTLIGNTAHIHFDTNPAITTNTVTSLFIDCGLYPASITEVAPGVLQSGPGLFYQWYNSDGPIIGAVDQEFITFVEGDFTVAVTNVYGCNSLSTPFSVIATSMDEGHRNEVKLFPVPLSESARLVMERPLSSFEEVHINDMQGRTVRILKGNNTNELMITRATLNSGPYVLHIHRKDDPISVIFVVE
ncbi:MAG TPA: hypothetical protein VGE21_05725, partial [Flavobacteriales bacterium]